VNTKFGVKIDTYAFGGLLCTGHVILHMGSKRYSFNNWLMLKLHRTLSTCVIWANSQFDACKYMSFCFLTTATGRIRGHTSRTIRHYTSFWPR